MDEVEDFIFSCGITKVSWQFGEKQSLVETLCKYLAIDKSMAALEQFKKGMATVSIYQKIQEHSKEFEDLFISGSESFGIEEFFNSCNVNYSPRGSNKRSAEEATILVWEEFIDSSAEERKVPLKDLLIFITGSDAVPPGGFSKSIDIEFYDQSPGIRRLPFASTCALQISLPRNVQTLDAMVDLMTQTIFQCQGFGQA